MGANKRVKVGPNSYERVIHIDVPGLHLLKKQVSGSKYFSLIHSASGLLAGQWTGRPIMVKDKIFIERVEATLKEYPEIDWTKTHEELRDAPEPIVELLKRVGRDLRTAAFLE